MDDLDYEYLRRRMMPSHTLAQRLYRWACERLYAELAWSYDWVSWLVSMGAWRAWQATALPHIQGERVLEIGFGTGKLLTTLAQQSYQVTGLEYSTAMHRQTTRTLAQQAMQIPRVQARAQQMPFATAAFDTIIATFPTSYIVDPATLAECARLLQAPAPTEAGGRLVVVLGISHGRSPWHLLLQWLAPNRADSNVWRETVARFAQAGLHPELVLEQQGSTTIELIIAQPTLSVPKTLARGTSAPGTARKQDRAPETK